MRVVAIVAARGGSKGIPRKNLAPFCGRPLLAWTVEQAVAAPSVESVWVSSDDAEILAAAAEAGAEPVERPAAIAGDEASSEAAWLHALDALSERTGEPDLVVALQATSPLREPEDIERGIALVRDGGADSVFSGAALDDFFVWRQSADGALDSVNYDWRDRPRRQDVLTQYVENGSFYVFRPDLLRTQNNRLGGNIGVCPMELWKSFEIDTEDDLLLCQALMSHYLLEAQ